MKFIVFLLLDLLCFGYSLADRIDDDIKNSDIIPCRWTSRVQEAFGLAERNGYPILTFWSLPGCHLCKIARTYITRDSFQSFINQYGTIYLAYGDLVDDSFNKWRENLFKQIEPKYHGYPNGYVDGKDQSKTGGTLPLPAYTLHYIDNGQTNFLFHIYRHSYDKSCNYAFCPYHNEIKWGYTLYAWSDSEVENGFSNKYDFPFIKVLKEYLEKVSPSPITISVPTPQAAVQTNSSTTTYTRTIHLDNIVCRFTVSVDDALCKNEFSKSSYTNSFDVIDQTGCWFIDADDHLRAKSVDFAVQTDTKCELFIRARKSGTIHIASSSDEQVSVMTMRSTTVLTNEISNSASMSTTGSIDYETATELEEYGTIDREFPCVVETSVILSPGDVIKLFGSTVKCTVFEFVQ